MATSQKLQLDPVNLEYSRFIKDQVLTEVQLNEIIDFFEDQNRLTRTCLIGVGIVCGLKVKSNNQEVQLSAGVSVTTDGDLIRLENTTYKYFTEYKAPDECKYDPFYFQSGGSEKMVTLLELLTNDQRDELVKNTNAKVFAISELSTRIPNWVALLYLEYFSRKPEKCTPTNCDNLGSRQVARPRIFALSRSDMDQIIRKEEGEPIGDSIYTRYHSAETEFAQLPVIAARRVILNGAVTLSASTLAGAYCTTVKQGSEELCTAIAHLYRTFRFVLDREGALNTEDAVKTLKTILTEKVTQLPYQYVYDFYKDIIQAYNELRDLLCSVALECLPDLYSFPKHIMLGAPDYKGKTSAQPYRHKFYPSPAVSDRHGQICQTINMMNRLITMITTFSPNTAEDAAITPSKDYDQPLGSRAIPFYYQPFGKISPDWNHNLKRQGREKHNLSFGNKTNGDPLDRNIDGYDFFRIEGHMGKDYKTALAQIIKIRDEKGIPVDVVAVRLGDVKLSDINLDDYACQFEDLNTMLRAFQAEMKCLIGDATKFLSGFTLQAEKPHISLIQNIALEGANKWIISEALVPKEPELIEMPYTGMAYRRVMPDITAASETMVTGLAAEATFIKPKITAFCDRTDIYFKLDQLVKTEIEASPESLGKYYMQAMETSVSTVEEFMEKARSFVQTDLQYTKLTEDQRYVVFEYPMQIIGFLDQIQRFIPESVKDISNKLILDYQAIARLFCRRLKVMQTRLESYFKSAKSLTGYENRYMEILGRLPAICCGSEKLDVILKEIEKRKATILQNLVFARFAQQHPGMEHKAGVHRGGTFVLVYATTGGKTISRAEELPLRELTGRMAVNRETGNPYRDIDTFSLFMVENEEHVEREAELALYMKENSIKAGSVYSQTVIRQLNDRIADIRRIICREIKQPEKETIIADFCLPYLCCSTCPPVAFIIEKEKPASEVKLKLPEPRACITTGEIAFTEYAPAGEKIESKEAPEAIIMVNSPRFDTRKVPQNALGKPVTFTVGGKPTDCSIVVYPELQYKVSGKIAEITSEELLVLYNNKTDESISGKQTYIWKFGDLHPEHIQEGTGDFRIAFNLKILRKNKVTEIIATVAAKDDICNSTPGTISVRVPVEENTNECNALVKKFIEEKLTLLKGPGIIRRLRLVRSPEVQALLGEAVNHFTAADALNQADVAGKSRLIMVISDTLIRLYGFQTANLPEDAVRILEELVRSLLMLMLNLVRCDKTIVPDHRNQIIKNLATFHEHRGQMMEKYFQLDFGNILEKEVDEYNNSFISQDTNLKKEMKTILEDLKTFKER
jgi:hypothetical protein